MATSMMIVKAEFTLRARARVRLASWCLDAAEMLLRTLPANVQVGKLRFRKDFAIALASVVMAVMLS